MEKIPTKYNKIYEFGNNKIIKEPGNNFFAETMIMSHFKNCFINRSEDILIKNNKIEIVMEKAQGACNQVKTVNQIRLDNWLFDISSAVAYLHKFKIIHGDIKPSNILIYNKEIKLHDFELSCFILHDKQQFENKMYTRQYRAPEVWNTNEWGFPADIWALGCTLYKLIYKKNIIPDFKYDDEYIDFLETFEPSKYMYDDKYKYILIDMLHSNPNKRSDIITVCNQIKTMITEVIVTGSPTDYFMKGISNKINGKIKKYYSVNNISNIKLRNSLLDVIQKYSTDSIFIDLVASLYEQIEVEFNSQKLHACCYIIHYIVFGSQLNCECNKKLILEISKQVNYNFINWVTFFRIDP